MTTTAPLDELRFATPLYTAAEAARALGVSRSTFGGWLRGYTRRSDDRRKVVGRAVLAMAPSERRGAPVVPFVGLAEGMVLAATRRAGVPLQRIRPALESLEQELGVAHALASHRLYTDGAELLYDFAEAGDADAHKLVVVRSGQTMFTDVVAEYLQRLEYGDDGYVRLIRLPGFGAAEVVADPERAWGQPIFARGGARVSDVLGRFWAGEDLASVADEFGVPQAEVEDAVRAASRPAA